LLAKNLILKLSEIQHIAKEGEWEKLDTLMPSFLADTETLQSFPKLSVGNVSERRLIEAVQQMLQETIYLCSTRMEQIGPLLNALKITQTSTEAP